MKQARAKYEIIVADDGSEETNEEWLKKYFEKESFRDYKLVLNTENHGTVKNILSGLSEAGGKYIKLIGAGDMLFGTDILMDIYEFMESRELKMCFGLLQGFSRKNGRFRKNYFSYPRDIETYRKKNKKAIARNVIYYSDHISGAAMFFEKETLQNYLDQIKDYVKYEEDLLQVLAVLNDEYFELYDHTCVYYEVGSGVSDKNSPYIKMLNEDVERFYEYVYSAYADNKYVKKRKKLEWSKKTDNIYLRTILRLFKDPYTPVYVSKYFFQILGRKHEKNSKETT